MHVQYISYVIIVKYHFNPGTGKRFGYNDDLFVMTFFNITVIMTKGI